MEGRSVSEDDSSENSQSSGKSLKPKRRSMVERELETNMTARVTSPMSFIEPSLNTSRYGRARKIKVEKEFCDTNRAISDYLKSPESEWSPKMKKSSPNTSSTNNESPKRISSTTKADNLIEKLHNENLSLSRFGSITKASPVKQDKTYVRKDLIQRKDNDDPSLMLKNMFSPSKSPYKSSKSSHLSIFLERSTADKSGIEMNDTVTTNRIVDTPNVKESLSKQSRKRVRKSDSAITETKKTTDSASSTKSSSTKKQKRHTISAANAVVIKTLDFDTITKKEKPRKKQQENNPKREQPEIEQLKSNQPKIEKPKIKHPQRKQTKSEQPESKQLKIEQPQSKQPMKEQKQPKKEQTSSSSKKKSANTLRSTLIEIPEPQGLLIEKTSVVKTLDFDIKKKPTNIKSIKIEYVKQDTLKPVEIQAQTLEYSMPQEYLATNGLFEMESLCGYSVGDLAWSRVGSYPFWPCIVTREPFTELFVKKKLFGRVERDIIHVTFFADNGRRGWIVDSMLRQYHGIEEFLTAREGFTIEDKRKDPKLYAAYFISEKKRETWNQAVTEAENLLKEPIHIRTDILYDMLSQNKLVKILKKPKNLKVDLNLTTTDLIKPKTVKLNRTDSDVSLSESLYDSLFSDDDSKIVDPDKSKNKSRNKSFDVSDVVTACLDNMAVKTGMAKIQMQSHMDRWLQKAKSQTPEKNPKVLTPNKNKRSLSLRKNKKTSVETVVGDKTYPLRKFAKESPENGILNSYQTEHDYTKCDIENENPGDSDDLNAENSVDNLDEVHYIESGTGIGIILTVESLSDKISDNQETLYVNDMETSTGNDDIDKDNNEKDSSKICDSNDELTDEIGDAIEIEKSNSKNEDNVSNFTNLQLTDTKMVPNTEVSALVGKEADHDLSNNIKAADSMDFEQDIPKNIENDLATNLSNTEDDIKVLSSEATNRECDDISGKNNKDAVLSSDVNDEMTNKKCLAVDQTNDSLKTTEINSDISSKSDTNESIHNVEENIVNGADNEMQTDPKQDLNTDSLDYIEIHRKDHTDHNQKTNAYEEMEISNSNIIQNHEDNDLKNDDVPSKAIVKNNLQNSFEAKSIETINKTEKIKSATRKSLRTKSEPSIKTQVEDQVKKNNNIEAEPMNSSEFEINLPEKTDNKNKSVIENKVKNERKDSRKKCGRLSTLDKLNQTPQVNLTKLNLSHMELYQNRSKGQSLQVVNDIKTKNLEDSCSIVIETTKENNFCDSKNEKTGNTELIENTLENKQILKNGFSEENDTSTSNQFTKFNGTSEIQTPNEVPALEDCINSHPKNKVTKDLLKVEDHKVRKSKRIKISKKWMDKKEDVDIINKTVLLQDIESNLDHSINSLQDIQSDVGTDNIITDEKDPKARHLEKKINLIASIIEPTPDLKEHVVKDVEKNVNNVIQVDDVITNNANIKESSCKKKFNNLCDQRIHSATFLEKTKPNSKTIIYDNDKNILLDSKSLEINSENAKAEVLCSNVDVNLSSTEHFDLTSIKVNKLPKNSNTSDQINENAKDISIQMTDYDNLELTPEKIINADVIFDNGQIDELDSNADIKLEGISIISPIDTPLPRKRGRPRKSNKLVIDNVVIEEISLTDNQNDKVTIIEDLKPRKRGRPKKYQIPEQDKVLTNGYNGDIDSLPEFAHLMDLDVSLDGADFNQAVKVENISLLTAAEVLAKGTETNLGNTAMVVDNCQVVPVSFEENFHTFLQASNENANVVQERQDIVDVNARGVAVIETSPVVALITEQDNDTNVNLDKPKNSKPEIDDKSEDMKTHSQTVEISLSSISIKSEIESISSFNAQSENDDKQSFNDEMTDFNEISPSSKAEKDLDLHQEKDQETLDGTSKRKQRVKPENKLTNEVYKALDDPEFAKYLEMRQDALIDENPHVSQEDIVKYLYKTWIYEQSLKPDAVKSDDLIELNLVKGLGNNTTSQPKRTKKKVKSQVDKEEKYDLNEVVIPRDRSKRKTNSLYINADDTDIEDELESFEIFKSKNKAKKVTPTASTSQTEVITKEEKTGSELDDIPLANLIVDKDKKLNVNPEDVIELIEDEPKEEVFNQVEYYFLQLTQPKPNVFKGLVRERVCDICFKTSNLVKCRGPCNGMFHIDCVKEETTQIQTVQNIWARGRKKKKPRGPRPKNRSQDDSQSDDKDINIKEILDSSISVAIDADNFETQLAEKMKEMLEKEKVEDFASSDEELQWDDADPGKCEIVNITLKTRRYIQNNSDLDFKCNDCLKLTIPKCYVCKSEKSPKNSVELRQRCQIAQCHKYYHLECLDMWPQTQFNQGESARKTIDLFDILSCPRHVCHSCVCDDPRGCNTRFSGEKLARCVKCPATYHSFTKCLPAGSQILSASHIICPRHTVNRPGKVPCHVNTGWCFICALGGSLICCEYCPTSFHADCLNIATPEGNYMCEDCETGRLPLYGEMVWVKLGHYRWWPGLVLHPCEIPDNIKCMRHSPGEFVVRFFGQYDHYWVNRGRVFPFQEGDSGRISSQKSKIDEAFTLAIEHAKRAFQILKTAPPNSEEETEIALSFLPPQYVKLRSNKPCGSVSVARADDESGALSQCDCDASAERPCDATSSCLNRMLLTECGPFCRAGDRCQNRAFEKRQYPKMAPYRTPHRGWGLRTQEEVKAGQFVIEYVGELIDETEFKRRMQLKHEIRDENYYFLTLDKERMIDAGPKGNLARFMNHSCEPNCETQKWTVLGDVRVGLFALHDIPAFTELTFNYNLECAGIDKKRCMCGAPRCSGYIGAKPKTLEEINPKKTFQKKRIYKKRKKEDSPSTIKIKIPKPRTTTRSKPKELTEIEKDLLIIKSATNGIPSSDSECSLKLNLEDKLNLEKSNKRSWDSMSSDYLNSDGVESSSKVLKLDRILLLDSESGSSEGNR